LIALVESCRLNNLARQLWSQQRLFTRIYPLSQEWQILPNIYS
jgi:hypothetical protein